VLRQDFKQQTVFKDWSAALSPDISHALTEQAQKNDINRSAKSTQHGRKKPHQTGPALTKLDKKIARA